MYSRPHLGQNLAESRRRQERAQTGLQSLLSGFLGFFRLPERIATTFILRNVRNKDPVLVYRISSSLWGVVPDFIGLGPTEIWVQLAREGFCAVICSYL